MTANQLLERADILLDQKRYRDAERFLKEALSLEPQNDRALGMLARCYLNNQQTERGMEVLARAMALDPNNAYYHYLQGFGQYIRHQYADAAGSLLRAISLDPVAGYYGLLAYVYLNENFTELALQKAEEGLSRDAGNIACLNAKSSVLRALERKDEAESTIKDALSRDPENRLTYRNYGWQLVGQHKHKEAISQFYEALRLDPNDQAARSGLKEALKARLFLYRWFLRLAHWVRVSGGKHILYLLLALVLPIWLLVKSKLEMEWGLSFFLVLAAVVLFIVVVCRSMTPLANFVLLFHAQAKHTLTRTERWNAITVVSAIIPGLCVAIFSSLFPGVGHANYGGVTAAVCFSLCLPLAVLKFPPAWSWKQVFSSCIVAMGVVTLVVFVLRPAGVIPFFIVYWAAFFIWLCSGSLSTRS